MDKIFFIRHGETNVNAKGLMHKSQDETLLSDHGKKQSKLLAKEFKRRNIDTVYSSSEKRAVQTATIIANHLSKNVKIVEGFEERNWGELSGKPWSDVEKVIGDFNFRKRYEFIPPGGESWKEFEERLMKTLYLIIKENKNRNIVIVTHGGVIRALMPTFLRKPKTESYKYDPENASITEVKYDDGKWKVERVDDVKHLNSGSKMEH